MKGKYTDAEIGELITKNMSLVYKAWSELPEVWVKTAYRDDLLAVGIEKLTESIRYWDPERGTLSTYCYMSVKREMGKLLAKICNRLFVLVSIDEPMYRDEDEVTITVGNALIDESEDVEERALKEITATELRRAAEAVCGDNEIKILNMFCYEYKSYTEIAKELGYTRQRLGQLVQRIRKKILEKYEKGLDKSQTSVL